MEFDADYNNYTDKKHPVSFMYGKYNNTRPLENLPQAKNPYINYNNGVINLFYRTNKTNNLDDPMIKYIQDKLIKHRSAQSHYEANYVYNVIPYADSTNNKKVYNEIDYQNFQNNTIIKDDVLDKKLVYDQLYFENKNWR